MTDDILERLRDMERVQSQWDSRPEPRWKEAADEIQRLRKRNNYLRQELSATDYRKREQADEIKRLRALITAWADADDAARRAGRYSGEAVVYESVRKELRKAVGR